ncbi:MAG: hypothetical protein HY519_02225, partial [Candidatus Aenigmarchaeota archaeon]|nr:hypothetical protein [Candidatus Aenigmarchaeota archaeon]
PKPVRDQLGIAAGQELVFSIGADERLVLEKKSSKQAFKEFVEAIPKKKLPKRIDWDREYYSQLDG